MQNAIMASFHHCTSTDDWPKHHLCPEGKDSWCFMKRHDAREDGTPAPLHKDYQTCFLNKTVAPYVKKVFERLSSEELLQACMSGSTQNNNEAFHSQVWLRCNKAIFVGRTRVEIATALAVCEWNRGSVGTHCFMWELQLPITPCTLKIGRQRNVRRLANAEMYVSAKKRLRTERRRTAQREEQVRLEREAAALGGAAYASVDGTFPGQ